MASFNNRYKIEGILMTCGPLHIGNGATTKRPDCSYLLDDDNEPVEISAVATDADGRAYIPGTVLKGNLRAWSKDRTDNPRAWEEVFGVQELGGKAEFWDSPVSVPPSKSFAPGRCWSAQRLTSVAASVAIDRRTRTAGDRRLFHKEFVPKGIGFQIIITAQDLTSSELDLLLSALDGFNHPVSPATLGAKTSDHWGRVEWKLESVREINTRKVIEWLKSKPTSAINKSFDGFSIEHQHKSSNAAGSDPSARVSIDLDLNFSGLFLVNDPSQVRTGSDPLGHAPTSDETGRPYLPASSFRGALRSQAEMILRTIGGPLAAWRPGDRKLTPRHEAIENKSQLADLCLASQVFGAPGWRTPIELTDFTLPGESEPQYLMHEMLAIDRFTGGSPEGLKFNAKALCQPRLQGKLTLNLGTLERSCGGTAGLMLLAFVLRDLIEGDIAFGFGAGKGYGACRASIRAVRWPKWESIPAVFRKDLNEEDIPDLVAAKPISEQLKLASQLNWFEDLKKAAERRVHAIS
jgi:CRISPR/Cas system CSM-associated protein Csm3 (group 7 of RAMP superfamily)